VAVLDPYLDEVVGVMCGCTGPVHLGEDACVVAVIETYLDGTVSSMSVLDMYLGVVVVLDPLLDEVIGFCSSTGPLP
jgi:hypothetical protein